jgi:hypothetical protein
LVLGARCWWRSWLRHCAACRKVAGSTASDGTGIFQILPATLMLLGSTHMSTRSVSWGSKDGRCVGLTNLQLFVPIAMKCGSVELLEPSGPVQGFLYVRQYRHTS